MYYNLQGHYLSLFNNDFGKRHADFASKVDAIWDYMSLHLDRRSDYAKAANFLIVKTNWYLRHNGPNGISFEDHLGVVYAKYPAFKLYLDNQPEKFELIRHLVTLVGPLDKLLQNYSVCDHANAAGYYIRNNTMIHIKVTKMLHTHLLYTLAKLYTNVDALLTAGLMRDSLELAILDKTIRQQIELNQPPSTWPDNDVLDMELINNFYQFVHSRTESVKLFFTSKTYAQIKAACTDLIDLEAIIGQCIASKRPNITPSNDFISRNMLQLDNLIALQIILKDIITVDCDVAPAPITSLKKPDIRMLDLNSAQPIVIEI